MYTKSNLYQANHKNYIESSAWQAKKNELREFYVKNGLDIECVKCHSINNLHVHHNYYIGMNFLGYENLSDLDYLCDGCHRDWHDMLRDNNLSQNSVPFSVFYKYVSAEATADSILFGLNNLLLKKVDRDYVEIDNYFSRGDVREYEKLGSRRSWLYVIAFVLIPVYLIGFILLILMAFFFKRIETPWSYDLFQSKRIPVIEKRKFIADAGIVSLRLATRVSLSTDRRDKLKSAHGILNTKQKEVRPIYNGGAGGGGHRVYSEDKKIAGRQMAHGEFAEEDEDDSADVEVSDEEYVLGDDSEEEGWLSWSNYAEDGVYLDEDEDNLENDNKQ